MRHSLVGVAAAPTRRRGPADLTDREIAVLAVLAEGVRTREIAERLALSEKTVQRHLANIYAKIGVDNRVAAARYYQEIVHHHR